MSDYLDYQDQVFNDIAIEFGLEATTLDPRNRKSKMSSQPLSVAQCQRILHRYGFDKAMEISNRYALMMDKWIKAHQ